MTLKGVKCGHPQIALTPWYCTWNVSYTAIALEDISCRMTLGSNYLPFRNPADTLACVADYTQPPFFGILLYPV